MWMFLALVAVPILEIALFIELGGLLGLWPTLGVVVLTALAGAALLRAQGFRVMRELQVQLEAGQDPAGTLAHGAMILVSGILLLTPGFFTDTVGFLLLVPAVRRAVIARLASRVIAVVAARRQHGAETGPADPGEATVETDYREIDPEEEAPQAGPKGRLGGR